MKKILFSCILMLGISFLSSASNSTTNLSSNNKQMPSCTIQMTSSCSQTWTIWMQDCTWESILENLQYIEYLCKFEDPE